MLTNFRAVSSLAAPILLLSHGCGSDEPLAAPGDETQLGSVELALSTVPDDVSCIAVSARTSSGATLGRYDVSAGQMFSTIMTGLPFAEVQFSGEAFNTSCSDLADDAIPDWVSPLVTKEVKPGVLNVVTLVMRRNGRICVEVTFEDEFGEAASEAADVCSLPQVVGPCDAVIPRFSFNQQKGRCEKFTYGGCGGNENNFLTAEACEAKCEKKGEGCVDSVCELPPGVPGPCKAALPRWTFNADSGVCERFIYGGCGGNENNFPTREACEGQCGSAAPPCSRTMCGPFQTCEINEPTGEAYCADTCRGRICPAGTKCHLQEVQCIRAPCPPVAVCK